MYNGTNTLKNCRITANKLTDSSESYSNSAYGGGICISGNSGTNTLENCDITNNTAYASSSKANGGGAYIGGGTNTLTNCNITGNTASARYNVFGGGVNIWFGTNTLENCDITGNTAYSSSGVYGGGVYLSKSSTLLGKINITSNTAEVSSTSSDNNLYVENKYTVTLKSGSKSLSSGSKIGVMTDTAPTASAPVQFAESATSEMVDYFTPDNDTYYVDYENDGLYLKVPSVMYSDLYYKNDVFYSDPSCTATTGMTKLADAVVCMNDGGTIHMLSSYVVDRGSQTVAVPKDRSINIVRDGSFSSGVMFNVPGGSLSVKVPDTTKSKLTISGEDIDIGSQTGEAFTVSGSGSLTLEGASSINRNLVIKKHKATSCAMNLDSGSCLMKNCFFTENTATGTSGGGIYTLNCKTIFDGCKISGNRCNGNGNNYYLSPAGILVARSGTTTLVGDMEVLDNYNTYDNSQANLEILFSGTSPIDYYSIALSYTDSNGVTHKLTSGEGLVRTCSVSILAATRIFATGATADMVKCFAHDTNSSYQFKIDGTDIYMYVSS